MLDAVMFQEPSCAALDADRNVALTETVRLAIRARHGLRMVAAGQDQTMEGWLIFGAALNEGRELFPSDDRAFGKWLTSSNLDKVHPGDQQAAMWAAANSEEFEATRQANPRVRTVRGLHATWKNPKPSSSTKPVHRAATLDDFRRMERLRALRDDPSSTDGERAACQRKLDDIETEIGKLEPGIGKAEHQTAINAKKTRDWRMESFFVERAAVTFLHKAAPQANGGKGNDEFTLLKKALRKAYADDPSGLEDLCQKLGVFD